MAVNSGGGDNPPLGQITMTITSGKNEIRLGQSIKIKLEGALIPSVTYQLKQRASNGTEIIVGNFDENGEITYTPQSLGIYTLIGSPSIHNTIIVSVKKQPVKNENYIYFTKLDNPMFYIYVDDVQMDSFTYNIEKLKTNDLFDVINLNTNNNAYIDLTFDDIYDYINDIENVNAFKIELGDEILYVNAPTNWIGSHSFANGDFTFECMLNTNLKNLNNFSIGIDDIYLAKDGNDYWILQQIENNNKTELKTFNVKDEKDVKIKYIYKNNELYIYVNNNLIQSFTKNNYQCKLRFNKSVNGQLIISDLNFNVLSSVPIEINKVIPLFRTQEIITDYENVRILDNKCVLTKTETIPSYVDFYNNYDENKTEEENDEIIMSLDENILPVYKFGDVITYYDINNFAYLLRKYVQIDTSLRIEEGIFNGIFANYEFILENLSIVDNGILITDETLEGNISIILSDMVVPEANYYIDLTFININDTNISNYQRLPEKEEQVVRIKLEKDGIIKINLNEELYDINGNLVKIEKGTIISLNANIYIDSDAPFIERTTSITITVNTNNIITENTEIIGIYRKDGELTEGKELIFLIDNTEVDRITTDANGEATFNINLYDENYEVGNHTFQIIDNDGDNSKIVNINYELDKIISDISIQEGN